MMKAAIAALALSLVLTACAPRQQQSQPAPSPAPSSAPGSAPSAPVSSGPADQWAELRASVPYPGPRKTTVEDFTGREYFVGAYNPSDSLLELMFPTDPLRRAVADFLVPLGSVPEGGFSLPGNLGSEYILEAALTATLPCQVDDPAAPGYTPELKPIMEGVGDSWVYPREHVEQNIKYFFGDDVVVEPQSTLYDWHAAYGVFTPFHMGATLATHPVILELEDQGDKVKVQVVFLGPIGYIYGTAEEIQEDIDNTRAKYELTLQKNGDSFYLRSAVQIR